MHVYIRSRSSSYVGLSFKGTKIRRKRVSRFSSLSPRSTALCSLPLSSGWIVRTEEIGSERDDELVDSRRGGGESRERDGYA